MKTKCIVIQILFLFLNTWSWIKNCHHVSPKRHRMPSSAVFVHASLYLIFMWHRNHWRWTGPPTNRMSLLEVPSRRVILGEYEIFRTSSEQNVHGTDNDLLYLQTWLEWSMEPSKSFWNKKEVMHASTMLPNYFQFHWKDPQLI